VSLRFCLTLKHRIPEHRWAVELNAASVCPGPFHDLDKSAAITFQSRLSLVRHIAERENDVRLDQKFVKTASGMYSVNGGVGGFGAVRIIMVCFTANRIEWFLLRIYQNLSSPKLLTSFCCAKVNVCLQLWH
jgi:hypothetical protein